ncbi:hypothetical protein [Alkalimonas amylolytica]|uniref:Uncharacterized protein n=1 Tax=Alkalimonas amylolytica TaxID=152573 RepID=A0A1H4F4I2_ALKAM|nr:hypothetical protein [Alkalimonas amylolytica]SEA92245.1 hypothetical protein SAMN04488051_1092 [Alkalimonas amylolytica]
MRKLIVALLFFIGFSAQAQCQGLSCSGQASDIIHSLRLESKQLLVALPVQDSRQLNCLLVEQKFAQLQDSAMLPQAHALLLTALMNQQQIRLEFDPQNPECTISAIELLPRR